MYVHLRRTTSATKLGGRKFAVSAHKGVAAIAKGSKDNIVCNYQRLVSRMKRCGSLGFPTRLASTPRVILHKNYMKVRGVRCLPKEKICRCPCAPRDFP